MIPDYYEFQNSVKILSGKNALENIPFELYYLQASRPILLYQLNAPENRAGADCDQILCRAGDQHWRNLH